MKNPETVEDWVDWVEEANAELSEVVSIPVKMIRPRGEPLSDKERVHREEWIEGVAQDIGKTAEKLFDVLKPSRPSEESLRLHEPHVDDDQSPPQSSEESR